MHLLSAKISVTCFNVFISGTRQSRAATSHLTSGKTSPIKAKAQKFMEQQEFEHPKAMVDVLIPDSVTSSLVIS